MDPKFIQINTKSSTHQSNIHHLLSCLQKSKLFINRELNTLSWSTEPNYSLKLYPKFINNTYFHVEYVFFISSINMKAKNLKPIYVHITLPKP